MEKKNPFYEQLKQYVGKQVVVQTKSQEEPIEGKLLAVNFLTLNFIVQGDEADYILRDDISYIKVIK